jgi:hypothetical protein
MVERLYVQWAIVSSWHQALLTIPADQRVRGAVVLKLWLGRALQLRDDPLGKCFA